MMICLYNTIILLVVALIEKKVLIGFFIEQILEIALALTLAFISLFLAAQLLCNCGRSVRKSFILEI